MSDNVKIWISNNLTIRTFEKLVKKIKTIEIESLVAD